MASAYFYLEDIQWTSCHWSVQLHRSINFLIYCIFNIQLFFTDASSINICRAILQLKYSCYIKFLVRSAGLEPTPQASETCTLSSWAMSARTHHNKKNQKVKQISKKSVLCWSGFKQRSNFATENPCRFTWFIAQFTSQYRLLFTLWEIHDWCFNVEGCFQNLS